jgi:hypothetical protein
MKREYFPLSQASKAAKSFRRVNERRTRTRKKFSKFLHKANKSIFMRHFYSFTRLIYDLVDKDKET